MKRRALSFYDKWPPVDDNRCPVRASNDYSRLQFGHWPEPDALFIDQVIGQVKAVGAPELLFGPGTYYYSIGIIRTILTVAPASKLSPYPDIGPPVEARPKAARQRHTHGQRRARGLLGSRRSRGVGRGTSCRGSTSNGSQFDRPFLVLLPYSFLRPVSLPVLFSRGWLLVPTHPNKLALTLPSPRGVPLLA
ncbi:hypothetical protein Q3G72_026634 [Acer saccharum]|nr:hypothetical protein Q3G72_026634 [Acer saccharum]